jgi:hypothetical protein
MQSVTEPRAADRYHACGQLYCYCDRATCFLRSAAHILLIKPSALNELRARIRALVCRAVGQPKTTELHATDLALDTATRQVSAFRPSILLHLFDWFYHVDASCLWRCNGSVALWGKAQSSRYAGLPRLRLQGDVRIAEQNSTAMLDSPKSNAASAGGRAELLGEQGQ